MYSHLGISLCDLLKKIDFTLSHLEISTILLNIAGDDCLYFFIHCWFFFPWSHVLEQ